MSVTPVDNLKSKQLPVNPVKPVDPALEKQKQAKWLAATQIAKAAAPQKLQQQGVQPLTPKQTQQGINRIAALNTAGGGRPTIQPVVNHPLIRVDDKGKLAIGPTTTQLSQGQKRLIAINNAGGNSQPTQTHSSTQVKQPAPINYWGNLSSQTGKVSKWLSLGGDTLQKDAKFLQFLPKMPENTAKIIKPIVGLAGDGLSIVSNVTKAITDPLGTAITAGRQTFTAGNKLVSAAGNGLKFLEAAAPKLTNNIKGLGETFNAVTKGAGSVITHVGNAIETGANLLSKPAEAITKFVGDGVNGLRDGFKAVEAATKAFPALEAAGKALGPALKTAGKFLGPATAVVAAVPDGIDAYKAFSKGDVKTGVTNTVSAGLTVGVGLMFTNPVTAPIGAAVAIADVGLALFGKPSVEHMVASAVVNSFSTTSKPAPAPLDPGFTT